HTLTHTHSHTHTHTHSHTHTHTHTHTQLKVFSWESWPTGLLPLSVRTHQVNGEGKHQSSEFTWFTWSSSQIYSSLSFLKGYFPFNPALVRVCLCVCVRECECVCVCVCVFPHLTREDNN